VLIPYEIYGCRGIMSVERRFLVSVFGRPSVRFKSDYLLEKTDLGD